MSPDQAATRAMIAAALDFADVAEHRGLSRWADVLTTLIGEFVGEMTPRSPS